jgi:protein gp37
MQHTKIEWADYVWNPIKGVCPVGCWYCYARKIYQRFGLNPEIRLDLGELMANFPRKPSRIFACSTFELFHPFANPYRNNVFKHIGLTPEHTFIILTKMPERIDRPMPGNVWLGVTCDGQNLDEDDDRLIALSRSTAKIKFISYEPMLRCPRPWERKIHPDWIIVGRITPRGGPDFVMLRYYINSIITSAKDQGIPIFLKNNLREIWGEPLIQEFPK